MAEMKITDTEFKILVQRYHDFPGMIETDFPDYMKLVDGYAARLAAAKAELKGKRRLTADLELRAQRAEKSRDEYRGELAGEKASVVHLQTMLDRLLQWFDTDEMLAEEGCAIFEAVRELLLQRERIEAAEAAQEPHDG